VDNLTQVIYSTPKTKCPAVTRDYYVGAPWNRDPETYINGVFPQAVACSSAALPCDQSGRDVMDPECRALNGGFSGCKNITEFRGHRDHIVEPVGADTTAVLYGGRHLG
jgi:hypothetical protein